MAVDQVLCDMKSEPQTSRAVVLVHGIWDTSRVFARMSKYLADRGFRPLAVDLKPSDGSVGLDKLAEQLREFVERDLAPGESFDLVGFSMGGLVSRYYVQRLGGIDRVGRLITIASPHRGTYWAYTAGNVGSRQMRPGSEFLVELNRDMGSLELVKVASIWTPLDLMIVPAGSSRLGVGEEFRVVVGLHAWLARSRACFELVGRALTE
jgi:triacylglycerol lipase